MIPSPGNFSRYRIHTGLKIYCSMFKISKLNKINGNNADSLFKTLNPDHEPQPWSTINYPLWIGCDVIELIKKELQAEQDHTITTYSIYLLSETKSYLIIFSDETEKQLLHWAAPVELLWQALVHWLSLSLSLGSSLWIPSSALTRPPSWTSAPVPPEGSGPVALC